MKSVPLIQKANASPNAIFAPVPVDLEGGGGGETAWGDVTGKPSTFPPEVGTTATTALAGDTALLQLGTTAGTALAGNTAIPTLPALASAAELQAGTVTATRLVSPKLIHDEIARQIAAIPAP